MTQEEKELLLKDLYPRLPYMPRVRITYQQQGVKGIDEDELSMDFNEQIVNDLRNGVILDIKLYLRPMSSMTEEERKEHNSHRLSKWSTYSEYCANVIDWLNARHFDYRGLIEKGLAIEVT